MSRRLAISGVVMLMLAAMGQSNSANAQFFRRLFDPCNACGPPVCCCPAPAPICPPITPCAMPYTTQVQPLPIQTGFAQPGCNSCGATAWNAPTQTFGSAHHVYPAQPQFASHHTKWQSPPPASTYHHIGPTPDPNFAAGSYSEAPAPEPWTTITSRARHDDLDLYASDSWRDDSYGSYDRRHHEYDTAWRDDDYRYGRDYDRRPHADRREPYITAPSAALVWQSNRGTRKW